MNKHPTAHLTLEYNFRALIIFSRSYFIPCFSFVCLFLFVFVLFLEWALGYERTYVCQPEYESKRGGSVLDFIKKVWAQKCLLVCLFLFFVLFLFCFDFSVFLLFCLLACLFFRFGLSNWKSFKVCGDFFMPEFAIYSERKSVTFM